MPATPRIPQKRKTNMLLFINKSVESGQLNRSGNSTEAFKILSHVQNRRRRRESLSQRLPALGSSEDGTEEVLDGQESLSASRTYRPAGWRAVLLNFEQNKRTACLSSVHPNNNPLDPFNAAVVPINSRTLQLLQYAFSSFTRRTFMAEALPPPSELAGNLTFRHDEFIRIRLQQCVEDFMVMDSTLAMGVTCAGWTTEQSNFEKPLDFFLGRALRAVRTRLASSDSSPSSSPDRNWLLLSVYSLSISTFWLALTRSRGSSDLRRTLSQDQTVQYLDAAVLHLKVARSLIAEAGGMTSLHPCLLSSLILGDKYLAICRMQPPILPLEWDPGRLPQDVIVRPSYADVLLSNLGASLVPFLKTQSKFLGSSLHAVIVDVVDYLQISRSIWHHAQPDENMEQWLFLRAQALFYRLLSMQNLNPAENCTRLTTLIFLLSLAKYQGMVVSLRVVLPQLADLIGSLQGSEKDQFRGLEDLLFWAICIAGVASVASENTNLAVYPSLQAQAISIKARLGFTAESSLEECCVFLTKYLFLPDEQEPELRRFLLVDL